MLYPSLALFPKIAAVANLTGHAHTTAPPIWQQTHHKNGEAKPALSIVKTGATDGIRTHDNLNHNQGP